MSQDVPDNAPRKTIGVPRECFPGEQRAALVPADAGLLIKAGFDVIVERALGSRAGYRDEDYAEQGAELVDSRNAIFERADVITQVRTAGANRHAGADDLSLLRSGQTLIGMCDPLGQPQIMQDVAAKGVTCYALELLPRITRAQSMDVLSSQASIAGYKAVLTGASLLPRMCPMMMTAAGTIAPARFFIIGAGVAGLQAIATARRMGAVVWAYDIRPAVKEEVLSLGAKFLELDLVKSEDKQSGGYAQEMDEEFYRKQREAMTQLIAETDVLITTAAVPGRKAPTLVTTEMIKGMPPGSVVIDLAAEQGGNCEPTKSGEVLSEFGVTIDGTINVPATVPFHSSQMFGRNVATLLKHLQSEGALDEPSDDEIVQETLVTRGGEVVHARVRDALGLPALNPATTEDAASEADAAQSETDSTSEPEGGESAPESSSTSN
jgi:NAD(P) transhydrogenase subunit alpha